MHKWNILSIVVQFQWIIIDKDYNVIEWYGMVWIGKESLKFIEWCALSFANWWTEKQTHSHTHATRNVYGKRTLNPCELHSVWSNIQWINHWIARKKVNLLRSGRSVFAIQDNWIAKVHATHTQHLYRGDRRRRRRWRRRWMGERESSRARQQTKNTGFLSFTPAD